MWRSRQISSGENVGEVTSDFSARRVRPFLEVDDAETEEEKKPVAKRSRKVEASGDSSETPGSHAREVCPKSSASQDSSKLFEGEEDELVSLTREIASMSLEVSGRDNPLASVTNQSLESEEVRRPSAFRP